MNSLKKALMMFHIRVDYLLIWRCDSFTSPEMSERKTQTHGYLLDLKTKQKPKQTQLCKNSTGPAGCDMLFSWQTQCQWIFSVIKIPLLDAVAPMQLVFPVMKNIRCLQAKFILTSWCTLLCSHIFYHWTDVRTQENQI